MSFVGQMSELIQEIKRGKSEVDITELVSKLPPDSVREADMVLGVLFNGYGVLLLRSTFVVDFS